jgi:hypothetical protein
MSKTRMVLLRIAGSVVGLLVVGIGVGVALFFILSPFDPEKGASWEGFVPAFFGFLGGVAAGTLGAAVGATVTQKLLGQRSSFWRALLGAVVGLVVGAVCGLPVFYVGMWLDAGALVVLAYRAAPIAVLATTVAGAVIGSGWKAKPRDAASPSG